MSARFDVIVIGAGQAGLSVGYHLARRGLRFVRYADDCNVYVRSERAAQRAFENLTRFIEDKLKLKVNRAKSAVARPWQRKLLGFSFTGGKEVKRRIAPQALQKVKDRIRGLTQKSHRSFPAVMADLRRFLLGWLGYFRFCETRPTMIASRTCHLWNVEIHRPRLVRPTSRNESQCPGRAASN